MFCTSKVLSTLHEYPCLESCPSLIHYVSACARLAWKMVNQKVPYYLDNDFNLGKFFFNSECIFITLFNVNF